MSMMKNEAPTVFQCDKTFKIIMDQTENQRQKKSNVHVILARFFLFITLILMAKTLCYDAQKLK